MQMSPTDCDKKHKLKKTKTWCSRFYDRIRQLQWRHNEHKRVSNHRRLDCLFNRLFRHRSKKTPTPCVTDHCEGNPPVTGEFPHKGPLTRKMFPMMRSSNGNIFRVTGHLCGEFTSHRWNPHTKASDAEIWRHCSDLMTSWSEVGLGLKSSTFGTTDVIHSGLLKCQIMETLAFFQAFLCGFVSNYLLHASPLPLAGE